MVTLVAIGGHYIPLSDLRTVPLFCAGCKLVVITSAVSGAIAAGEAGIDARLQRGKRPRRLAPLAAGVHLALFRKWRKKKVYAWNSRFFFEKKGDIKLSLILIGLCANV